MKRLAQGCALVLALALALALFLLLPSLSAVCAADTGAADSGVPQFELSKPLDSGVDGAPPETVPQDTTPTIGESESVAQSTPPVLDSGEPQAVGCSTAEELLRRLRDEPGGIIELTGDIAWELYGRVALEEAVTVRMGDYGILIADGGVLLLEGPVRFEGSGAIKPLFTVEGQFYANNGVQIAAQGNGAVAILATGYGGADLSGSQVSAEGESAVAVRVENEDPYFPRQTEFLTRGTGSRAIEAAGPVEAFLCRIRSDGGEAVVSGGEIRLLGCAVDPDPADAESRAFSPVLGRRAEQNGICLPVGTGADELESALERIALYELFDGRGGVYQFPAPAGSRWEGLPDNLDAAGSYTARLVPGRLPAWFPLELPVSYVPIHLVDPDQPFLAGAEKNGENVSVTTYAPIEGAESLRLLYSADGEKWADAPIPPERGPFSPKGGTVGPLEEEHAYYFRLEVEGGPMEGGSNTLKYLHTDSPQPDSGGDLDGGDRDDQGDLPPADELLPPNIEPEPTPKPDPPSVKDPGTPGHAADGERESGGSGVTPPDPAPSPEPAPSSSPTPQPKHSEPQPSEAIPAAGGGSKEAPSVPPTPPQTKPAVPAGATIALTAAELSDQLEANPAGLTLVGGGLKVFLPTELMEGWEGPLAARLDRPAPDRFEVRLWANEKELDGFDSTFTVTVPVSGAAGAEHSCTAPDGGRIAASAVADGRADFALADTGLYTLSATAVPTAASPDARPASMTLPLVGAGALLAWTAGVLYRRRGKR